MTAKTLIALRAMTSRVMNGAGSCKDRLTAGKLAKTKAGAVVFGSITWNPRPGNSGNVYHFDTTRRASFNSIGLKNPGANYWRSELQWIADLVHGSGKTFSVSIAGETPAEYADLAALAEEAGTDWIEINSSCPNRLSGEKRKPIMGFRPERIRETLVEVRNRVTNSALSIGIKVPPYSDPSLLEDIATMITNERLADFVVTMNTFPNALITDQHGTSLITVPGGYAGCAGPAIFGEALGQVQQWTSVLGEEIPVIGVGGVWSKNDVLLLQQKRAQAVQATTFLFEHGVQAIDQLI